MPIGIITKKTNIEQMERVGIMPVRSIAFRRIITIDAKKANLFEDKKITIKPTTIMRSKKYADKIIESEGFIEIRDLRYYQRIFTDGCAELVRYDAEAKIWAILCFPNEDNTATG